MNLMRNAAKKPLPVIWFRLKQAIRLFLIHRYNLWARYQKIAENRWSPSDARQPRNDSARPNPILITSDKLAATKHHVERLSELTDRLSDNYREVRSGRIRIFGTELNISDIDKIPWNADWRYGHIWPAQYFQSYNFYEFDKSVPYDVKFPWELSRLGFLVSPTLWATLNEIDDWWDRLADILESWVKENPIANSLSWMPMECSVRSINLVFLVALALNAGPRARRAQSLLLSLCEQHGRFIYRTLEYSDIRGNHYAANVAAMVLLGLLLTPHVSEAGRWCNYGRQHLAREILLQFCDDGVQFEKSIPYHRLVLEFFLIAVIALEDAGFNVQAEAKDRLREACKYTAAYTRPDGRAPMWGDNDDATVLNFDISDLRDHRNLLGLAAAIFGEKYVKSGLSSLAPVEVPLLMKDGLERFTKSRKIECSRVQVFPEGGMVFISDGSSFLMTDVGEVGLKGRGGHGHLDALSFELVLDGQPIIIDPGSFVYTGDPKARNDFRSTRAHNVVRIDAKEIASLDSRALWQLGNEADPYDILVTEHKGRVMLFARHDGYRRFDQPVSYCRTLCFDYKHKHLEIVDGLTCQHCHKVERFFHFSPELRFEMGNDCLAVITDLGGKVVVSWESGRASLVEDWVSYHYGKKIRSYTLVLYDDIMGPSQLRTRIFSAD